MDGVKDYPPYLDHPKPRKVQTNADRIRAMSDKELARLLFKFCCNSEACIYCPLYERDCAEDEHLPTWENWLQQPVKEG